MLEDERNLIIRAKGGEAEAFGLLYDEYLPKIYRFVLLKTGHREEAEDLTHQVFLQAWRNIRNYDDRGYPFSSWLYRIAKNLVVDYYRRLRPNVSLEDCRVFPADEVDPETDLDLSRETEKLARAVGKLRDTEQTVVIMRFVDELSIKETAAAIEKSEGAVKLIQHRAIQKLKKLMTEEK
ncbi:MAG TPA: sigma-70 family RNA polymerase sigma factor [Candidatus Colwellbacteria bacterium]|nr:sigma-70 family RNA polymerase sigma factor [Candidatus Colwellbacteria bacterium]HQA96110.1 sigma-70 family RNA polymerase sigma factor [Candidatus Colwellbacteria bacterium]